MRKTIMLYGATGYTGRLIAAEMQQVAKESPGAYRMVLAGRDAEQLAAMAEPLNMDRSVFDLEDDGAMLRALRDADVVINAAGPFAFTGQRLVDAVLAGNGHRCHYVDINGEADVYYRMRERRIQAYLHGVALVCAAGFWAAASSLLLQHALQRLIVQKRPVVDACDGVPELGAVRIAMSRIKTFSQGSARTVWRSLREQVTVAGIRQVTNTLGEPVSDMVLWREPVGRYERVFDFAVQGATAYRPDRRIASLASLVDTQVARLMVKQHGLRVGRIESYVEAGVAGRLGYQLGAMLAPVIAVPVVRAALQQPVELLPEGPDAIDRQAEGHRIVLQIEDVFRSPVIEWCWDTPNVYQFTAQLVLATAQKVVESELGGWLTPGDMLQELDVFAVPAKRPLRGCKLMDRSV